MIKDLAQKLIDLRKSHGYTQDILAQRIGITKSSVHSWETGRSQPTLTCLMKLAALYHVSVDYLLGLNNCRTIDVSRLDESEICALVEIVRSMEKGKL